MIITAVKIRRAGPDCKTDAVGYADVTFDQQLMVRGYVIRETTRGLQIVNPTKYTGQHYIEIVKPLAGMDEIIKASILKAFADICCLEETLKEET